MSRELRKAPLSLELAASEDIIFIVSIILSTNTFTKCFSTMTTDGKLSPSKYFETARLTVPAGTLLEVCGIIKLPVNSILRRFSKAHIFFESKCVFDGWHELIKYVCLSTCLHIPLWKPDKIITVQIYTYKVSVWQFILLLFYYYYTTTTEIFFLIVVVLLLHGCLVDGTR